MTFTLTNPSANTAPEQNVAFTDNFPSGLVVATPSNAANTCADIDAMANAGSSQVTAQGILIPVGGSCTLSLNVVAAASGSLINMVTISSSNGGTGNTASATLNGAGPPSISTSFGAATVPLNGATSLSFTISNPAGNGTATGVAFTDTLPSGLVVATPNGLSGTCGGGTITAVAGSGSVSLSGATLADGASCTFSVGVTPASAGVKNNSVMVSSTSGGIGNTATASLTVVAPPTLSASFAPTTVALGGSSTLSFTVSNPNASLALSGVSFSDTLPSGLVVSTPNGITGTCGGGTITATAGSGAVSLSGATLAPSASCAFSLSVTATSAGTDTDTTSTVASNEGGPGGQASATLVVSPPAGGTTLALSITQGSPSLGTFTPGAAATYTTTLGATVTSTAALTTLTAADMCTPAASCFPGHLVNTASGGPYEIVEGLQIEAISLNPAASGGGTYVDLSADNPATILSYSAPVSDDAVTIGLEQPVGGTDPLRTGTYSKTITLTLSSSTP